MERDRPDERPGRRRCVVVRFRAGPGWRQGGPEDQDSWPAHADFVDRLTEQGTFVMGGPFADHSGSQIVLVGVDPDQARALVADDPFVHEGVFVLDDVRPWVVYVDEWHR